MTETFGTSMNSDVVGSDALTSGERKSNNEPTPAV